MKAGRRTKYTPDTIKAILDAIKVGGSDVDACAHAGISQDTFYEWMNSKSEFSEQVTRARTDGKLARIGRIVQAGVKGDWRADAWYLERRWPEEYAQQLVIKVAPADLELVRSMGFNTAAEAWQALIDNARKEYDDAHANR